MLAGRSAIRLCFVSVFTVLSLSFLVPAEATSGEVTEQVRTMINSVIDVFNDKDMKSPEKSSQRNQVLREKADRIFDWDEMAKRTLGRHWRDITDEQQKQFIDIFVDFLQRVYLGRIDTFMDQIEGLTYDSVDYLKETKQGRFCMVETVIKIDNNQFPVNYRLVNKDGKWVVYDVSVEGIGLVANYRTQFNDILNRSTFDELIQQLKKRKPEDEKFEGIAVGESARGE